MAEFLKKELVVKINDKSYSIPFPKVRHQFDIESRKMLLSNNTYGVQERAGTDSSAFNLNLIDAIAHFTTLLPELYKDLGVDSYLELDMLQAKDLVMAYKKEFYPWYQAIKNEVNGELSDEETKEDKK